MSSRPPSDSYEPSHHNSSTTSSWNIPPHQPQTDTSRGAPLRRPHPYGDAPAPFRNHCGTNTTFLFSPEMNRPLKPYRGAIPGKLKVCAYNSSFVSRVEIPLKNRSRYERFERFFSKIWAVWAVWAVWAFFFGKPAQTAQILLKKPLKNRSFLAVIFERFFKQDLSGF